METHVASACFLMHESTLLYLTQFGYLNCLIRTGHSRTYKYTAAQSTTQCLQIYKSTCAFQRDLSQSLCTSQAQRMRGLLHPPPPSQRWKKGLDKLKQLFSSNCIIYSPVTYSESFAAFSPNHGQLCEIFRLCVHYAPSKWMFSSVVDNENIF